MTTLQELIQQRDELNARIEDLAAGGKSAQRDRVKAAAKYINPITQQTWSGRGKRPQWIHDALAAGKSLDEFAV